MGLCLRKLKDYRAHLTSLNAVRHDVMQYQERPEAESSAHNPARRHCVEAPLSKFYKILNSYSLTWQYYQHAALLPIPAFCLQLALDQISSDVGVTA